MWQGFREKVEGSSREAASKISAVNEIIRDVDLPCAEDIGVKEKDIGPWRSNHAGNEVIGQSRRVGAEAAENLQTAFRPQFS
jgi:hypothetical protein